MECYLSITQCALYCMTLYKGIAYSGILLVMYLKSVAYLCQYSW